jgi:hypothetical protein
LTIPCFARRSRRNRSSQGCSVIGEPRLDRTSSTFI